MKMNELKKTECVEVGDNANSNTGTNDKNNYGTREWASTTINILTGCEHDCKYCYAKSIAVRFHKIIPPNWKCEQVRLNSIKMRYKKMNGRIMYPSSHDITPTHLSYHIDELKKILSVGNELLIVTKPHFDCVKHLCSELNDYKHQILFRFTIGAADSTVLQFWEPYAPSFEERMECLKFAHNEGFQTSVSCEPMLDFNISAVISAAYPFVSDKIWIGKANELLKRLTLNGSSDMATMTQAHQLIQWQSNDNNILILHDTYKEDPKIIWKDSISKVLRKHNRIH